MSTIILDYGSGNTCRNGLNNAKRMIDELKAVDTGKHEIIIKWQLFRKVGDNIPLQHSVFDKAYYYAEDKGYKTTSSVFDKDSLDFLLQYDIPFVKIANNRALDYLIGEVPRKVPVYRSVGTPREYETGQSSHGFIKHVDLICISKYPATIKDYETAFKIENQKSWWYEPFTRALSDHTIGLDLFKKYQPEIWEKHYKLSDSTGLDAGPFAITPEELREIL